MFKLFGTGKLSLKRFLDVEEPITSISSLPVSVYEDEKLINVIGIMLKKFRRIPIITHENHLKGIITISDILDILGAGDKYEIFLKHRKNLNTPVSKFMNTNVRTIDKKMTITEVFEIFKKDGTGGYPVVDRKKLIGMITEHDFVKNINRSLGVKICDVMVKKPFVVKEKYSLFDVAKMIHISGFRRLPVTDGNILIGIVTARDIVNYLYTKSKLDKIYLEKIKVKDIMNKNPVTIGPDKDVYEAVLLMKDKHVGGLPVVEENDLIGIITERDIIDILL
jgi:CBS domain-containing protein